RTPHASLHTLAAIRVLSFFFSSRRRHTRSKRDWSSDVCSSDLEADDALERGRLAGAVGADDADHLARAHVEGDVMEDGHLAVARGQPLRLQKERRRHHWRTQM